MVEEKGGAVNYSITEMVYLVMIMATHAHDRRCVGYVAPQQRLRMVTLGVIYWLPRRIRFVRHLGDDDERLLSLSFGQYESSSFYVSIIE